MTESAAGFAGAKWVLAGDLAGYREFIASRCGEPVKYRAGVQLSHCGETPAHMFFLLDGIVKAYTSNSSGYVRLLGYHKAGTLFVLDGLRGGVPSVVTTETVTSCLAIPVTAAQLHAMCLENAAFTMDLMLFVGDVLRLMCYDAESTSLNDVAARVANLFCFYMQSGDYADSGAICLSQDSIASAVNASRAHVARIIAEMKRDGVIDTGHRRITVLNEEALREMGR